MGFLPGHKTNVGKKYDVERIRKSSLARIGQKRTPEARKRMSVARQKQVIVHSEETKRKISEAHKGKKLSDQHRLNLSISHRGQSPANKGVPLTVVQKEHLSKVQVGRFKGEKHWNWQGGKTPKHETIRKSHEYKIWRKAIFERDNYTCIWCGKKEEVSGKLNADHIKPFSLFPELRFAIDNGRTLCIPCHRKTDTYAGKMRNYKC